MSNHPHHDSLDEAFGCGQCQASYRRNAPVVNPETIELIEAPPTRIQCCGVCGYALDTPNHELGCATQNELPGLNAQVGELEAWWLGVAAEEIERTVPKAIEYGSGDLAEIGRQMASVMRPGEFLMDSEAVELGIWFYIVGKLARWSDAVRTGREVSDDTLFDIGVYVRMAQRNRAAGGWPGVTDPDDDRKVRFIVGGQQVWVPLSQVQRDGGAQATYDRLKSERGL